MKTINSVNNEYIKSLCELKKNHVKQERGCFLVDGMDFIEMAYESNCLLKIFSLNPVSGYEGIENIIVSENVLKKLSSKVSSSEAIGLCTYPAQTALTGQRYVYLDGVQDPGNVGTIIRTALAFCYDGVILGDECANIYNDKVISSTKGAIFKMPIFLNLSLKSLKENGYYIISSALNNAIDYHQCKPKDKFVLVMGNEGNGVKKENLSASDVIVKISISNIDSLNVAIASGILLNEYRGNK